MLKIRVNEWPSREDLLENFNGTQAKEEVRLYLTEEFDTIVSFSINEVDLLSGYSEAFILPLHAFVRSLSIGLQHISQNNHASIPIYLQQHAISPDSPSHLMYLEREASNVRLRFSWGGQHETPSHLCSDQIYSLDFLQMQKEIIRVVNEYTRRISMLLGYLTTWKGKEISSLFSDFVLKKEKIS